MASLWFVERTPRSMSPLVREGLAFKYGHFLLRGIPPGDYKIFCWDEVEDGAWEDPDFLKAFEKQGQSVSMEEAGSKTVDVVTIKTKSPE
jgi:hypothetical protein